MTPNTILEFIPVAWGLVIVVALVAAAVIFISRTRRWGIKWALREFILSF